MIATLYRQPSHPRLPFVAERTRALIEAEVDVNQKVTAGAFLLNYYVWGGDTARAEELVALIRPLLSHPELTPLRCASWKLRLAIHHLPLGEFEKTLANIMLAGGIARDHGFAALEITALIFETLLFLCEADIARAEAALARVDERLNPTRRMDFSIALKFKGWIALAKGDIDAAAQFGEHAREVGEAAGAPNMHSHTLIYLAHFYSEQGEYGKAHAALDNAHACTTLERYAVFHFDAELVRADLLLSEGNRDGCAAALRTALPLGARRGYFSNLFWVPRMMERLCAVALEAGIETDYVKRLIARRGLQPPAQDIADWPWPLRVFTLGSFALERDGEPIRFEGKVPKKPLEMLKALIAFGGREVPSATICAALWPDAEADAADNALGITLQRLRKILGDERAVSQQGGKLTLDSRRCWVDAWALQDVLERAEAMLRTRNADSDLETAAERIRELSRRRIPGERTGAALAIAIARPAEGKGHARGAIARSGAGTGGESRSRHRALSPGTGAGQPGRGALPSAHHMPRHARTTGRGDGGLPALPGAAVHRARHPTQRGNRATLPRNSVSLTSFRPAGISRSRRDSPYVPNRYPRPAHADREVHGHRLRGKSWVGIGRPECLS